MAEVQPTTLFVANFPYVSTEDDLKSLFVRFGPIVAVRILHRKVRGELRSRGLGFIEFETEAAAVAAAANTEQFELGGRVLRWDRARPPRPRDSAFIGGIPEGTTVEDLKAAFAGYNAVDARISHFDKPDRPGFGFVKFATSGDQQRAIREKTNISLNGKESIVRSARSDFDARPPVRRSRRLTRRAHKPSATANGPGTASVTEK
jgi:RNA recognition motif-containing protein